MKTSSSACAITLLARLRKAVYSVKALSLSATGALSRPVSLNISRVREWFGENKQVLAATAFIIAVMYFIPYTFMLGNRERTVVGITLQILAGAILVFDQISSNPRIRRQVTRIIQRPLLFAFLMTFILLPFVFSIFTAFGDIPPHRWEIAGGVTLFSVMALGMFMVCLTLLQRIRWLRRENHVPTAKDRFDVSDLSLRNVGILFGASVLVLILLICLSRWLGTPKTLWGQVLLGFLVLSYAFTLFPLLIITPLYVIGFLFAKFAIYIRTKRSLEIWFWLFLFVLWAWGWLLLLLREFT